MKWDKRVPAINELGQVLQRGESGHINVGSRTPVSGTPAWATLEVVKGGFATGALLAGGALLPHEEARLREDAESTSSLLPVGRTERERLNLYFISEPGLADLRAMLETGRYCVTVPEEGALLVAAWLVAHGDRASAWTVIDAIGPFFDRLRFYPVPDDIPLRESSVVRLTPVSMTIDALQAIETPGAVASMNETLRVWVPEAATAVSRARARLLLVDPSVARRRPRRRLARHAAAREEQRVCVATDDALLVAVVAGRAPSVLAWATEALAAHKRHGFRTRFAPALDGLRVVVDGGSLDEYPGRRFLGWTSERHWLFPAKAVPENG